MGVIVKLPTEAVQVVPGAAATVPITVKNTGTIVDQFALEVLGDAAAWASVDPPSLSLFPDAEGKAVVRFAPPRLATVPAGPIVFGVRAASQEDPSGSAVEERTLVVAPFADTFAELLPRTSTGGRSGSHSVAVDNRGNAAVNATISGADPDNLLQIGVQPPGLVVDPGTAAFARVHVSPRKKFWRGQPKTRPFKIQVETPNAAPMTLDGTMLQQAVLPTWLMKALLACLVLAILAGLLWFGLFQPAMKSAAQQALADAGITPTPAAGAAATPTPGPVIGPTAAPTPKPTPTPKVSVGPTSTPPLFGGTPTDGRLTANTGTASTAAVPANTTLYITDLVFDNPNGLLGSAKLSRAGVDVSVLRLENFRSLDYHFVTPVVVKAGEKLTFTASCTADPLATGAPGPCTPSVYYSGFTTP